MTLELETTTPYVQCSIIGCTNSAPFAQYGQRDQFFVREPLCAEHVKEALKVDPNMLVEALIKALQDIAELKEAR